MSTMLPIDVFQWATTVLSDSLYEMLPESERYLVLCELVGPHKIGVSLQNDRVYFEGYWNNILEAQESLLEYFLKDSYQFPGEVSESNEESLAEKISTFENFVVRVEELNSTLTLPAKDFNLISNEYSQNSESRLINEIVEICQESIPEIHDIVDDSSVTRKVTNTKETKVLRGWPGNLAKKSKRNLQEKYKKHRVKLNEMYCEPIELNVTKSLSPNCNADVNEIYVDITLNSQLDDVSALLESSGILLPLMNEAKLDDETTGFSSHEINEEPGTVSDVDPTREESSWFVNKTESKETRLKLKREDEARLKSIAKKQTEEMTPVKYFCSKCSFKSKRRSHLEKHMVYHTEDCELFACNKCTFVTIRPWILRRHKVDAHDKGVLTCNLCSYCTDKTRLLTMHKRRKHGLAENGETLPVKPVTGPLELHCSEEGCSYSTSRKQLMTRHGRTHETQRRLALAREVGSRDFMCNQCDYGTWSSTRLNRHVASKHTNSRTHLCPVCGAGFKRSDSLAVHFQSHQRPARNFQCPVCPRTLRHRDTLKTHLSSVHSKVRTHLCATCGAAFKSSANHRKHVTTIHENPRAFQCTHCTHKFNTKFSLARHVRKKHRGMKKTKANAMCAETAVQPNNEMMSIQASQLSIPFMPANTILIRESLLPGLDARVPLTHPETPSLGLLSETDNSFCTANSETAAALLYLGNFTSY